ncbi:MAG: efflux RND transporter periplasmic adaptor subunit [Beijerinckiaceae bacterium]
MSAAKGETSAFAGARVVETATVLQAVNAGGLATAGLQMILQIERDARRAKSVSELQFLMANETRRAVGARQIFIMQHEGKVAAVSSLSSVDRQSPVVRWIERSFAVVVAKAPAAGNWQQNLRQLTDAASGQDETARVFPFPEMIAASVVAPHGNGLGAVVAVRETVFNENETVVLQRLCETYGHAMAALGGSKSSLLSRLRRPAVGAAAVCVIAALGFIPVPMTALAPAEVVPLEPSIIAAPIDGAIEQVLVDPNQAVKTGDVLFRYADIQSRGALDVAEREVSVAEAKLRQASQMAFVDPAAKRELAVARTEYRLKKAEHAFAADMHERSVVRAPKDGIAVFADKRELIGRPVNTGQRVMELADPARTQFRFQVPADDALVLKEGAVARVFMDSDPLNPMAVTITRASPMVKQNDSGGLAFRADAVLQDKAAMPALGHRGTAQISGDKVSLAFYLFRRPLAALRQRTGL